MLLTVQFAGIFSAIGLLFVLFVWYEKLREFGIIALQDNGLITFHSRIHKVTTSASDIEAIALKLSRRVMILKHSAGRIRVLTPIDDLDDFLHTVKSMNPNIEVSV
jgi:hypothetical protein